MSATTGPHPPNSPGCSANPNKVRRSTVRSTIPRPNGLVCPVRRSMATSAAALIHGPVIAREPPGQMVDAFPGRGRHIRRQIQQQQVGGTRRVRFQHDPPVLDRTLQPPLGVFRVGHQTQLAEQRPQLTGRQFRSPVHHRPLTTRRPASALEVGGAVSQHPGATHVDAARVEHLADQRQSFGDIASEGHLVLGGGPGQPQRRPDLQGGELPGEVVIAAASGHLSNVGGPFRLQVRHDPVPGHHQPHHVMIRQPGSIYPGQQGRPDAAPAPSPPDHPAGSPS